MAGAIDDLDLVARERVLAVVGERAAGERLLVRALDRGEEDLLERASVIGDRDLREDQGQVHPLEQILCLLVLRELRDKRLGTGLKLGGGDELHLGREEPLETAEDRAVVDLRLYEPEVAVGVDNTFHAGDRDDAASAVDEHDRRVLERDLNRELVTDDTVEALQRIGVAARTLVNLLRPRLLLAGRKTAPPRPERHFLGHVRLRIHRLPGSLPERHCHPFPGSRISSE